MSWPLNCVTRQERLANHTSFRIGGPAEWYAEPSDLDELLQLLQAADRVGVPVSVIGGGTNLLVADRGLRGVIVNLGRSFRTVEVVSHGDDHAALVRCGAALLTQRLVALACQYGWGGLETLAGLPGRLGGAVAMNAQDIGRFVEQITLVSFHGVTTQLGRGRLRFAYRDTALEPGIITEIILRFPNASPEASAQRIHQTLCYRNTTQDVRRPSAGCAFKNPRGASAGRLIDEADLKGSRVGDAQVSWRHANFIINLGQATCDDVLALMEHVQRRVARVFGVTLEPEIRILGERVG